MASSDDRLDPGERTTTPEERARAAALRKGSTGAAAEKESEAPRRKTVFDTIGSVAIDEDARQKYVLIQIGYDGRTRHLVRGSKHAPYHLDAAEPTLKMLAQSRLPGLSYEVLGGGRIMHDSQKKKINIFGHSYGFPWSNGPLHHVSAALVQESFPDFHIETSDEGY
ncbi:14 kDa phosphohistidine phosphatase [Porphyridium purpureum]|uniref:14 kDa phosphohistidine phosphatase n=1 Tax=Porphyridium purpureum TaxID=35688 RepID=A0A5J4YKG8_PORPP|nr:14 kDa phosphohistidine phosphatase [Porphyridium purpureum]|eukprot:POR1866..scf261_15